MAQLAIEGHEQRGSEVIALLEMLGGVNVHNLYGDENYAYYTIDSNKEIKGGIYIFSDEDLITLTLEKFLEKFPYKVGDKVWLHYENSTIRVEETITCMRWCDKWNYVLYDVSTCCKLRESAFTPYKEETTENKNREIMNAKEFLSNKWNDVVKQENRLHSITHGDTLLLLKSNMESYYKILYKKEVLNNILNNTDDDDMEDVKKHLQTMIKAFREDLDNRPFMGQTNSLSINITMLWENETKRELINLFELTLTLCQ